jgi:hypothetical protein
MGGSSHRSILIEISGMQSWQGKLSEHSSNAFDKFAMEKNILKIVNNCLNTNT